MAERIFVDPVALGIDGQDIRQHLEQFQQPGGERAMVTDHDHMGKVGVAEPVDLADQCIAADKPAVVDEERLGSVEGLQPALLPEQLKGRFWVIAKLPQVQGNCVVCLDRSGIGQQGKG